VFGRAIQNGESMPRKYVLRLYVVRSSSASESALKALKTIIAQESKTVFKLEVIDVRKHPQLAEDDKILAVPTLVKKLPPPVRKIIGDLSNKEKVLLGLDLISQVGPVKAKRES
jgi:circadian clock protein KaiB